MTPIPDRLKHRPVFNGYVVPVIADISEDGRPNFAINDAGRQRICAQRKLCPICGNPLDKELWFIGGPLSAFHQFGYYVDSGMHNECAHYALQTCPYLAIRNYEPTSEKRFDALKAKFAEQGKLTLDNTMVPDRPRVFVLVMAYGQSVERSKSAKDPAKLRPLRPYHAVEFWQHGQRLAAVTGINLIRKVYPNLPVYQACRLVDIPEFPEF